MNKGHILFLGASSDIAKATALRFAGDGFGAYLAGRNLDELGRDASDIRLRTGAEAEAVFFDVLDFQGHRAFYDSLAAKPVGVVCAVGYLGEHEKAKVDFAETKKIIDTNFTGPASILNIAAADFEARGEGFIIGISSVAGDRGRRSNYYYGSAKAGFSEYLSGLRNRLSRKNVHVLTVKPGFVRTKMTENMNLPAALTAMPEDTARNIYDAWKKKRDVLYTKWFWRFIMLIIKHIPERIFKKMSL